MEIQPIFNINSANICTFNVFVRPQMFSVLSTPNKVNSLLDEISSNNLINRASDTVTMLQNTTQVMQNSFTSVVESTSQMTRRVNNVLNDLEARNISKVIEDASTSLGIASDDVNELALKAHGLWNDLTSTTTNIDILDEAKWLMPALGVRIGIQVYQFFRATSWFDRALSIAQIFLDFFIDLKMLRSIRDFLFQSFGHLPGPVQVVEGERIVRPQSFETADGLTAFFSSLVAIAGTITVGCVPDKNTFSNALSHFSKKMDVMSRIWRGTQAIQNMFKFCVTTLQELISYFMNLFLPNGIASMTLEKQCEGIHEWAKNVYEMGLEDQMTRYSWDEAHRLELFKLKDQGDEYYGLLCKLKKPNQVAMTMFHKNMDRLIKLCEKVHKIKLNSNFRIDPFCIWLDGPPGCSKSYCMMDLINACASDCSVPRYNRFYARNLAEAFWSKFSGQFGVGLDDMGASKNSVRLDPWGEFMIMKSNNPFQVQMAELSDKGMQFTSKMIVASSNMAYPHPVEITNIPALWRRRNILASFETTLTPDQVADQAGQMSHLKIKLLDPMHPGTTIKIFDKYEDFVMYVRVAFQIYLSKQEALVELNSSLHDKRRPLDPVMLSPESFKAFAASKKLQEEQEEILRINAALQIIDPDLDVNGNYNPFKKVKSQALEHKNQGRYSQKFPINVWHRNMPIGDIGCFMAKVKYEDYKPVNNFVDQRLSLFVKWYTGLNLYLQEDILKLRADSVGKYQEFHVSKHRNLQLQPLWAPDWMSSHELEYDRVDWISSDLADLCFIPPHFTRALLKAMILEEPCRLFFRKLRLREQECLPMILAYLREYAWDYFDQRFPQKLPLIEPPQVVNVGHGDWQIWARRSQPYDRLLPTTFNCNIFKTAMGTYAHCFCNDNDKRTMYNVVQGYPHYTRSEECYMFCIDEWDHDSKQCIDPDHVDIPSLAEISKHVILKEMIDHLPINDIETKSVRFTPCVDCIEGLEGEEVNVAFKDFYGRASWYRSVKDGCRAFNKLTLSQGITFPGEIYEMMANEPKFVRTIRPQGYGEILGGIGLAAVASYGIKTKLEWNLLLRRVNRLKHLGSTRFGKSVDLKYEEMDILEVDRGDYLHYGIVHSKKQYFPLAIEWKTWRSNNC